MYVLVLSVSWVIHKCFRYRFKVGLCRALGRLMYRTMSKRYNIIDVNLSICFPDMGQAEKEALIKRNFEQWSVSFLEIAMSWWGKTDGMLDRINFTGTEHLDKAIAEGNGVILLGGHFATLELGSVLIRKYIGDDVPMHVVYRNQKNPLFNAVMLKGRCRHVSSCVSSKEPRKILKLARSKEMMWYAPDHDHGIKNAVFAPFFGHPAATLTTTSTLAQLSDAAIIVMGNYRNENYDGYTVRFSPPLTDFPSDDPVVDATRVNKLIEEAILEAPDQYMWGHRRFKTQPDLPRSALYNRDRAV